MMINKRLLRAGCVIFFALAAMFGIVAGAIDGAPCSKDTWTPLSKGTFFRTYVNKETGKVLKELLPNSELPPEFRNLTAVERAELVAYQIDITNEAAATALLDPLDYLSIELEIPFLSPGPTPTTIVQDYVEGGLSFQEALAVPGQTDNVIEAKAAIENRTRQAIDAIPERGKFRGYADDNPANLRYRIKPADPENPYMNRIEKATNFDSGAVAVKKSVNTCDGCGPEVLPPTSKYPNGPIFERPLPKLNGGAGFAKLNTFLIAMTFIIQFSETQDNIRQQKQYISRTLTGKKDPAAAQDASVLAALSLIPGAGYLIHGYMKVQLDHADAVNAERFLSQNMLGYYGFHNARPKHWDKFTPEEKAGRLWANFDMDNGPNADQIKLSRPCGEYDDYSADQLRFDQNHLQDAINNP